jgi:hypothetical protein
MCTRELQRNALSQSRISPATSGLSPSNHSGSRAELEAMCKAVRGQCPRALHAEWKPLRARPDPVKLITESDRGRIAELVPIRHARMLELPFTFYRGAALNVAVDLASTPSTGIRVQCCGDAHLVNFRGFGTPERRVQLDIQREWAAGKPLRNRRTSASPERARGRSRSSRLNQVLTVTPGRLRSPPHRTRPRVA